MNRKLPTDAFEFYFGLGNTRSYQAVAEKFGVAKKTVVLAARRENWQPRMAERERQAAAQVDQRAVETLTAMKERHLKMLEAMQRKALETLRSMPMQTAFQAVRTLISAMEQERIARGEAGERTALDIEAIIKNEYRTLILAPGAKDAWDGLPEVS